MFTRCFMKINASMFILFLSTAILASIHAQPTSGKYTLNGYISEKESKELLIGASVHIVGTSLGSITNNYGFYALTLPEGTYTVTVSYIGFVPETHTIRLNSNTQLNVELSRQNELEEVIVSSEQTKRATNSAQMSMIELPVSQITQLPALLGEKDVLKALQLLPGVQSGMEGNSGIYVRGGGPDQNLIILDDAPIYNASHLFGFFSVFNGDAIKNVQLTKGGFPARYGGRLSSVLDMSMKDGNKEKTSGEVGVGLISSRATIEIPVVKQKSSLLLSGRRTYIDLLIRPFTPKDTYGGYYFYDLNIKYNYEFSPRDKLYVSGYFGKDSFVGNDNSSNGFTSKWGLNWKNATGTIRRNKLLSDNIFTNTSFIFSHYRFNIYSREKSASNEVYEMDYRSQIQDIGFKYDLLFVPHPQYTIRGGIATTWHHFKPNAMLIRDDMAQRNSKEAKTVKTLESGVYIENDFHLWNKMHINAGMRWSHYLLKEKTYQQLEPRLSASVLLPHKWAIKASYATMKQYVHLLSSSGANLPMDLWVPTTKVIRPQKSHQIALGLTKDLSEKKLSFSLEGYYKRMNNIIGYAPGANFLLVEEPESMQEYSWEESTIQGQGWSYGVEMLLHKKAGNLSGWVGYTLSWTQNQFEEDNNGRKFYPKYDRRHDVSIVSIYKISPKATLSANWVYGTGNALTIPFKTYQLPNNPIPIPQHVSQHHVNAYQEKGNFRAPAYHRLDLSIQVHTKGKRTLRTWDFGIYNLYARQNPFFVRVDYNGSGKINKLKQYSLFPFIPSVTYNLKF